MSPEKVVRYTAEQMRAEANFAEMRGDGSITSEMLRQAARTEADVAGLVEAVARTIREFEVMGNACGAVSILKQRTACENAMVAMKEALARFQP